MSRSRSGRCSQRRSSRPPIGVEVRSNTPARVSSWSPRQAFVELQIAAGGRVHDERRIALFGGDRQEMRQRRFLSFAHKAEQRAGRCNGQRFAGAAEAGQIAGAKLFGERTRGGIEIEVPGCPGAPRPIRGGQVSATAPVARHREPISPSAAAVRSRRRAPRGCRAPSR